MVLFCQYRYLAVEYLLVAVLNNLSSMRVNERAGYPLDPLSGRQPYRIVARIDLTE
ncbi:hypothetical protein MJ561_20490 [Klebsiella pneumoniae]|nr:hypothetical protein MJ561_20490 [Klebsiella pneumoniae]